MGTEKPGLGTRGWGQGNIRTATSSVTSYQFSETASTDNGPLTTDSLFCCRLHLDQEDAPETHKDHVFFRRNAA